mmetsp:Transcript_13473/g.37904  ORF Transcript_13473/g.37904 Transcript_13473/m.37904 type:complete len:263 (-) Transcript_13473:211-999(-)
MCSPKSFDRLNDSTSFSRSFLFERAWLILSSSSIPFSSDALKSLIVFSTNILLSLLSFSKASTSASLSRDLNSRFASPSLSRSCNTTLCLSTSCRELLYLNSISSPSSRLFSSFSLLISLFNASIFALSVSSTSFDWRRCGVFFCIFLSTFCFSCIIVLIWSCMKVIVSSFCFIFTVHVSFDVESIFSKSLISIARPFTRSFISSLSLEIDSISCFCFVESSSCFKTFSRSSAISTSNSIGPFPASTDSSIFPSSDDCIRFK